MRAAALRIHSSLIGNQTDAFAAQGCEVLLFEDVDAGLGELGACGTNDRAARRGNETTAELPTAMTPIMTSRI